MNTRQLMTALLFALLLAVSIRTPLDEDMWWHLRTGEYILSNGIPSTDPGFSFTANNEWFMHEWLSDVLMWVIYDAIGFDGLAIVFGLLVGVSFLLLYASSEGRPYLASILIIVGVMTTSPFINPRPQIFNVLLGASVVFLVENYRNRILARRWLWGIVPVMILWANLHSGFLFGIAILGVYIVGNLLDLKVFKRNAGGDLLSADALHDLLKVTIVASLASLLNPKHILLWLYPYTTTFRSNAMQSFIQEWQSPDFHEPIHWMFGSLLLGGAVIMMFSPRRITSSDLLFMFGTGAAALISVRNAPLFVVVTLPVVSRHFTAILRQNPNLSILTGDAAPPVLSKNLCYLNVGLAIAGFVAVGIFVSEQLTMRSELVEERFPVHAVDFLQDNDLDQARIFNDYNWGGYLIWRGMPTFIDGRADLYGDAFIFDYAQTYFVTDEWQETLNKNDIEYVLTGTAHSLSVLLEASSNWQSIYRDDVAVIYNQVDVLDVNP